MTETPPITSPTTELTTRLLSVRFHDLPADVVHQVKRLVLDTIACAFGGRQCELGAIALRYCELTGSAPAEATVIGGGRPASATAAATANGRMAGALDADDTFASAGQTSHHGASTVAAALALSERSGASGEDLVAAIAAGYELGARFGVSVPPHDAVPAAERSGSWRVGGGPAGVLSAALAGAHVLRLDGPRAVDALGIAGAHVDVPPLKWFEAETAPMVKSLDVGWNAGTGVAAALLASLGMTGHANILDGETGLWRALGYASFDFDALTKDAARRWHVLDSSFKRWPCQYWVQPALTAFSRILAEHELQADEIEAVTLLTNTRSSAPRFRVKQPEGFVTCQFNLPHPAAMLALRVPPGPRWFDDRALHSPEVRAFRERVEVGLEPAAAKAAAWIEDGMIRRIPGSAVVRARGRTLEATADAGLGAPWFAETRLSDGDLRLKLHDMAVPHGDAERARLDRIADTVFALDELDDVRGLAALLSGRE